MKIGKKNGTKKTLVFVLVVAFSTALLGCSGKDASNNSAPTPNVNRPTPDTPTPTPTPDPVQAIYGEWETDNSDAKLMSGGTTQYVRWKINPGTKDPNGITVGKISDPDRKNLDIANYKIGPQTTLTLEFTPPAPAGSSTYDFAISSDGNTLTLKTGSSPIVLNRGTSNRDIQKDVETISTVGVGWEPTASTQKSVSDKYGVDFDFAEFAKAIKSGEGYGGSLTLLFKGVSAKSGTYIIPSKNNVTIDIGAGKTQAKYALEQNGDLLKITFPDATEWVFNRK